MHALLLSSLLAAAPVNPVIGDASWVAAHGEAPLGAPEVERIRTHLLFVEGVLRKRSDDPARLAVLDALHAYAEAGVFPRHDPGAIAERAPRFIDSEGRICAVGRLIETTAGRHVAEHIGAAHEYERILEMDEPLIDSWARAHGFTRLELAMIQPMYDDAPEPPRPEPPRSQFARRGVTWSVRATMPILASDVMVANGTRLRYAPVGGGAEGSFGYEFDCGVSLLLGGGVMAHEGNAGVLTNIQTGLSALWTIEAGVDWVAPQLGLGAGLLLSATSTTGLGATGYGSFTAGARFRINRAFAIEAALAIAGALPGEAFSNPIAWATPSVSLSMGEF